MIKLDLFRVLVSRRASRLDGIEHLIAIAALVTTIEQFMSSCVPWNALYCEANLRYRDGYIDWTRLHPNGIMFVLDRESCEDNVLVRAECETCITLRCPSEIQERNTPAVGHGGCRAGNSLRPGSG